VPDEIGRLVSRFRLPAEAGARLECLADALVDDPTAPTAVRSLRGVIDDHLADSLVALELPEVARAKTVIDVGSGAGLPGVPLAIALPSAQVTLVESAARKCAFLERVVARCGVENVAVVHGRAEELAAEVGPAADLVTVRAVAALSVVAEYAAPMLAVGGALVAWRGRRDAEAEAVGVRAADLLGLDVIRVVRVQPYSGATDRYLHLMSKVSPTPSRFPRRPGMAAKRPLGRASW
jgi:16S rRNA (guanine527-N7)-methyltransferase